MWLRATGRTSPGLARSVVIGSELVLVDLAAQRIAMDAESLRGAGLIAVGALQYAPDKTFFEFPDGFVKQDAAFDHLSDEPIQLIFHDRTLHILSSSLVVRYR